MNFLIVAIVLAVLLANAECCCPTPTPTPTPTCTCRNPPTANPPTANPPTTRSPSAPTTSPDPVRPVYRDCDHAHSDGKTASGVYQIQPQGATTPFSVFCEMESSGGGWTVIQRRTEEGTVNFTRGWEDYKIGFGDLDGEFWLGLENIYTLTNQGQYALQIDFRGYLGYSGYTLYSSFKVENETDSYRLHLGQKLGGLMDCLNTSATGHNVTGMNFSTFDRDHDLASYNCAEKYRGGWWFNRCSYVIINGVKKFWRTHDQYREETRQGLGLYNVCLQAGPPVSLSDVTMKISTFPN